MNALYQEKQSFLSQTWLMLLVVLSLGLGGGIQLYGAFVQLVLGEPFGDNPMSDGGMIFTTLFTLLIVGGVGYIMFGSRLITEIHPDQIAVKFSPFHRHYRTYAWPDIERIEFRQYKPIMEYGGWGLRGWGKKRAFNVSGNLGMELYFKNGNRLLIGTRQPDELKNALRQAGIAFNQA